MSSQKQTKMLMYGEKKLYEQRKRNVMCFFFSLKEESDVVVTRIAMSGVAPT